MKCLLGRRFLLVAVVGVSLVGVVALPAAANRARTNGQIAFARFNPTLGDTQVYVVNPDGAGGARLVQAPTDTGECPRWFPDGGHIATCGSPALPGGGSRIINPDDGTYRDIDGQDPTLFNPCGLPSPDGTLLLCETFSDDGSQNGIHTIRSSDGGGFTQITSNPGGDDVPGSWSPNGSRIVFQRSSATGDYEGVFVVNANGTGRKRILPPTMQTNCCTFSWSPKGNEVAFSRHVTPDVHSSLWIVHSDGTGLRPVSVPPSLGCGGANDDPSAVGCLQPAWSPDGTKIAFAAGLTQVTHTGGANTPDWGIHPPTG